MEESGLDQTHCDPMRQPCGPPAGKPWRLLKPSGMTLRGSMMNEGEGHKSAARAGANLGPALKVNLGPSLGTILGAE